MTQLLTRLLVGAALVALAVPAVAHARGASGPLPGKAILEVRLRSESVAQEGFSRDAQAVTLRTRLGYETPAWRGLKALVEGEAIVAALEDYDSTTNRRARYPVVSDPADTELNRLQVSWTGARGEAVVGRQRLILGNARFVGNVGFRQNEQTFDAVKASARPTRNLAITYAYIDRVHRIFGDDSPQGEWDSDSHLINADLETAAGRITGYGYLLELPDSPTQSAATWGLRFAGQRALRPGLALTYEAEAARQTDYGGAPLDFELGYAALGLGLKGERGWASVGAERLDGDGRRGFGTPLATLHAFQGWADVFLATPADGVRDLNLRAGATLPLDTPAGPVRVQAAAHAFTDDDGSTRYGRELDLLVAAPINSRLSAEMKAALFDGAGPAFADRTKVWLTLEYRY